MYYIITPLETCEQRRIFLQNPRTKDGRVVLTQRDVQPLTFSLGQVEIVTASDMQQMIVPDDGEGQTNNNNNTEEE